LRMSSLARLCSTLHSTVSNFNNEFYNMSLLMPSKG
jgi:hypothetical protein